MHHSFAVVIILAAPFVAAQSLSSIPSCALPAAEAGIQKTGCDLSNTTCICGATSFLETVKQQISTVCSTADQETTINTAQQYCSQAGVPLALPSSPSPSNLPVSPRDSIDEVLILPLGQLNVSLSIPVSSSSSVPFPMTKTSSASPTNSSAVSISSTPSSIFASSTGIAALAADTLPPALIMPVGTTCPPPTTVTFYTTTTLSESSALTSASISPSPIPVSTFPSSISSRSPSSATILISSTLPSLSLSPPLSPSAAASSSPSPSPLTLTSTILTISSTSTLTLYSTTPPYPTAMNATTPPPYALSNASSSLGMNTTNNNNTTTMPFTAAAAAAMRGTMQTVAMMVVGLSVVGGMLFLY